MGKRRPYRHPGQRWAHGRYLEHARKHLNLTQAALVAQLDKLSHGTINLDIRELRFYEKGERPLPPHIVQLFCKFYDQTEEELGLFKERPFKEQGALDLIPIDHKDEMSEDHIGRSAGRAMLDDAQATSEGEQIVFPPISSSLVQDALNDESGRKIPQESQTEGQVVKSDIPNFPSLNTDNSRPVLEGATPTSSYVPISSAHHDDSILEVETLTTPESANSDLSQLLRRVRRFWITGVLDPSLSGAPHLPLVLVQHYNGITTPWRHVRQQYSGAGQLLPEGTTISQVYDQENGNVLILGEPGAGKTTLLLTLCRDLLNRAEKESRHPIPVVLNLASWSATHSKLTLWVIEELALQYDIPRKLGWWWIGTNSLVLLLDGLDEMEPKDRELCIDAINVFREEHGLTSLVVCSRRDEYRACFSKLRLHTCLDVQPLTHDNMVNYFTKAGKFGQELQQLLALQQFFAQDDSLKVLATTPLLLNIILVAYQSKAEMQVSDGNADGGISRDLLGVYVKRVLGYRGENVSYQDVLAIHWLTFLARQLRTHGRDLLFLEQLQPDWLEEPRLRRRYRLLVALIVGSLFGGSLGGLLGGFLGGLVSGSTLSLVVGVGSGLLLGAILGCFVMALKAEQLQLTRTIQLTERLTWSWKEIRSAWYTSLGVGILGGSLFWWFGEAMLFLTSLQKQTFASLALHVHLDFILFFVTYEVLGSLLGGLLSQVALPPQVFGSSSETRETKRRRGIAVGALIGLLLTALDGRLGGPIKHVFYLVSSGLLHQTVGHVVVGGISGVLAALIFSVLGCNSSEHLSPLERIKPNQGTYRSLHNSLKVGIPLWIIFAVFFYVASGVDQKLLFGIIFGGFLALIFGLLNGGIVCIQHVLLRFLLWHLGACPWNYARFLDYAAERLVLCKVGGGYKFRHPLFQKYFASL